MDRTPSTMSSLSLPSYYSNGSDICTFASPPPAYTSYLPTNPILILSAQLRKERAARRTERRRVKQNLRLQARFTPLELDARAQRRLNQQEMREAEAHVFRDFCMKRELKRAKKTARTAVFPKAFQTIDIHTDNDVDEDNGECEQVIITVNSEIGAETKGVKTAIFAGVMVIQDRLRAMSQALSEHTKKSYLRTEPGRHSFHVDAAVSREDEMTGIAVVHKTDRWYWASEWTAKGYRIHEALDQWDAEAWAVWRALQVVLEKVHADRAQVKPQDPCSLAVVYSGCKTALRGIGNGSPKGGKVVQKIIAQSIELQRLGVDVHLHWVPGHRDIPGMSWQILWPKRPVSQSNKALRDLCSSQCVLWPAR